MFSFLMPAPATVDKNPVSHTVNNSVEKAKTRASNTKLSGSDLSRISASTAKRLKNSNGKR